MKLRLGFSPCPNDTFIFHALVHGLLSDPEASGLEFDVALADVEALNLMADAGELDVAKISYHAYGYLADRYVLLPAGGALGQGVGEVGPALGGHLHVDGAGRHLASVLYPIDKVAGRGRRVWQATGGHG